ncbi:hypothetical protein ACN6LA_007374 [Streptomyces sp. SAS_269]|uniref:hypothetical protein n=1 Tax=Streptomyces sp. SAS_269 TaxID=3412749 RepID=UPI00403D16B8
MSEPNKGTSQQTQDKKRTAASAARRTAAKATAPASGAAKKAEAAAGDGASVAKKVTGRAADGMAGTVSAAAKGVEAGRRAAVVASGRVATVATTAWAVLAHRKLVAAGVSAGVTAVGVASYAVGRRSGRRTLGPITRFTGGRI